MFEMGRFEVEVNGLMGGEEELLGGNEGVVRLFELGGVKVGGEVEEDYWNGGDDERYD